MNTYTIDMGDFSIVRHATEDGLYSSHYLGSMAWKDVHKRDYSHLGREFKQGRRFVKTANGYAELGVWG